MQASLGCSFTCIIKYKYIVAALQTNQTQVYKKLCDLMRFVKRSGLVCCSLVRNLSETWCTIEATSPLLLFLTRDFYEEISLSLRFVFPLEKLESCKLCTHSRRRYTETDPSLRRTQWSACWSTNTTAPMTVRRASRASATNWNDDFHQ